MRRSFSAFGGGTEEADYVLRGTAKRTQYNGKVISYASSWLLGARADMARSPRDRTISGASRVPTSDDPARSRPVSSP
jgi:hypothetical protein